MSPAWEWNFATVLPPLAPYGMPQTPIFSLFTGFPSSRLLRNNPKEKTVHFGSIKGQAFRTRYMEMTCDIMDKDGTVRTLPLLATSMSALNDTHSAPLTASCLPLSSPRFHSS